MICAISGLKNQECVVDVDKGMKCYKKANCYTKLKLLDGIAKGRSKNQNTFQPFK